MEQHAAEAKKSSAKKHGEKQDAKKAASTRIVEERNTKCDRKTVEAISSVLCQVIAENFQSFGLKKKRPPPVPADCICFDELNVPDCRSADQLPTVAEMTQLLYTLMYRMRLPSEAAISMLVYIDRLIESSGLVLNHRNWKRVCFVALVVTQKVWDDYCYDNADYRTLMPAITSIREMNDIERVFLILVRHDVSVSSVLYSKYLTHLQALYNSALDLAPSSPVAVRLPAPAAPTATTAAVAPPPVPIGTVSYIPTATASATIDNPTAANSTVTTPGVSVPPTATGVVPAVTQRELILAVAPNPAPPLPSPPVPLPSTTATQTSASPMAEPVSHADGCVSFAAGKTPGPSSLTDSASISSISPPNVAPPRPPCDLGQLPAPTSLPVKLPQIVSIPTAVVVTKGPAAPKPPAITATRPRSVHLPSRTKPSPALAAHQQQTTAKPQVRRVPGYSKTPPPKILFAPEKDEVLFDEGLKILPPIAGSSQHSGSSNAIRSANAVPSVSASQQQTSAASRPGEPGTHASHPPVAHASLSQSPADGVPPVPGAPVPSKRNGFGPFYPSPPFPVFDAVSAYAAAAAAATATATATATVHAHVPQQFQPVLGPMPRATVSDTGRSQPQRHLAPMVPLMQQYEPPALGEGDAADPSAPLVAVGRYPNRPGPLMRASLLSAALSRHQPSKLAMTISNAQPFPASMTISNAHPSHSSAIVFQEPPSRPVAATRASHSPFLDRFAAGIGGDIPSRTGSPSLGSPSILIVSPHSFTPPAAEPPVPTLPPAEKSAVDASAQPSEANELPTNPLGHVIVPLSAAERPRSSPDEAFGPPLSPVGIVLPPQSAPSSPIFEPLLPPVNNLGKPRFTSIPEGSHAPHLQPVLPQPQERLPLPRGARLPPLWSTSEFEMPRVPFAQRYANYIRDLAALRRQAPVPGGLATADVKGAQLSHPVLCWHGPALALQLFFCVIYFAVALEQGRIAFRAGKYKEAACHFRDAVRTAPKEPGPRNNLILALFSAGQYEEALRECDDALTLFPGAVKTRYLAGKCWLARGSALHALSSILPCLAMSMSDGDPSLSTQQREMLQLEQAIRGELKARHLAHFPDPILLRASRILDAFSRRRRPADLLVGAYPQPPMEFRWDDQGVRGWHVVATRPMGPLEDICCESAYAVSQDIPWTHPALATSPAWAWDAPAHPPTISRAQSESPPPHSGPPPCCHRCLGSLPTRKKTPQCGVCGAWYCSSDCRYADGPDHELECAMACALAGMACEEAHRVAVEEAMGPRHRRTTRMLLRLLSLRHAQSLATPTDIVHATTATATAQAPSSSRASNQPSPPTQRATHHDVERLMSFASPHSRGPSSRRGDMPPDQMRGRAEEGEDEVEGLPQSVLVAGDTYVEGAVREALRRVTDGRQAASNNPLLGWLHEPALVRSLLGRMLTNAHELSEPPHAIGLFPRMSLFNHSCRPNCAFFSRGTTLCARTIEPICAGDELCFSYVPPTHPRAARQEALTQAYGFQCQCPRCTGPIAESPDRFLEAYSGTAPGCMAVTAMTWGGDVGEW
ncbi:putative SET and MYND domain-containing protein [Paratrimastix pyriformis]|uniref:SET and MYND domain-containing protein n=1 Tax=Paratrimastix pyriformis TaxID=342808 RepID=A0ABQ8U963_9EUKA|nr:putative SET and MYND domain-containing protein [Paratrimastix pyriformis]